MKRTIVAVSAVLLLAIVLGPLYGAKKTQDTLNQFLAYIDGNPAYEAEWVSYDKGWLTTDAVLRVTLVELSDEKPVQLPLALHVNHGPLLVGDGFKSGWFSGYARLIGDIDGWLKEHLTLVEAGPVWEMRFRMALDSETKFSDRSQPFSLQLDEVLATVSEYQGQGSYVAGGLLNYRGSFPAIKLEGQGSQLQIEGVELSTALDIARRQGDFFVPGEGSLSILSMKGAGPGEESIDLQNFAISTHAGFNADQALADIGVKAGLGSITFLGESVQDAAFTGELQRISLAFIQQYAKAAESTTLAADVDLAVLGLQLVEPIMTDLLPHGPRLIVSPLAFTTPEGSLELNLKLDVDPAAASVTSPLALAQYITIEATAVIDKPLAVRLVEQSTRKELLARQFEGGKVMTDAELEQAVKNQAKFKLNIMLIQRMLVQEKGKYRSKFNFAKGKATLNGQAVPLPF